MDEQIDIRAVACLLRHRAHWVAGLSYNPCIWCGVKVDAAGMPPDPIVFTWDNGGIVFQDIEGLDMTSPNLEWRVFQ